MNKVYYSKKFINLFLIEFFIIIISVKVILPQELDNIIRLGDDDFRYSHFRFNSNGDMIIDTESYPVSKERRFFGLKKNGQNYFTEPNNRLLLYAEHTRGRIEGESSFIKFSDINNYELIMGIPKNKGYYSEYYDFTYHTVKSFSAFDVFDNIVSEVFSIMEIPGNSENNYQYIMGYNVYRESGDTGINYLVVRIMKFFFNSPFGQVVVEKIFNSNGMMVNILSFFISFL